MTTFMDQIHSIAEYFFLSYFFMQNSIMFLFVVISHFEVRRKVIGRGFEDLDFIMNSPFTPPISIIVPSYNEEKTIVETVRSLILLNFPRIELVIVNDGSSDRTLEVVKKSFRMKRIDIDYLNRITTAPIKGFYEARPFTDTHVVRFVLVDKENGGKADALNAGINASRCPYFVSIDADAIIDEAALLQAFRSLLDNRNIAAIGGQVAIVNGCEVKDGKVVRAKLSSRWLVRFQIVEYIRSFTLGRTALAKLDSLLIISGVFGIFEKELVQKVGGYLTKHLSSKLANEYTGKSETICEDMEIIVRLQRYIYDKKLDKRIAFLPHPLCWTEAPETFENLSKQRNRWQRGFIETMLYHRKMLFNPCYGRIGLFALPYFLVFEFLGAPIEFLGYATLPLFYALNLLSTDYLVLFFLVAILYGILVSFAAIIISAWPEKTADIGETTKTLIYFENMKDLLILLIFSIMENFGYRQLTVWWRLIGIYDFFKGKKEWDKFARKGFGTEPLLRRKDDIKPS